MHLEHGHAKRLEGLGVELCEPRRHEKHNDLVRRIALQASEQRQQLGRLPRERCDRDSLADLHVGLLRLVADGVDQCGVFARRKPCYLQHVGRQRSGKEQRLARGCARLERAEDLKHVRPEACTIYIGLHSMDPYI